MENNLKIYVDKQKIVTFCWGNYTLRMSLG
jgi:hypothetical protein